MLKMTYRVPVMLILLTSGLHAGQFRLRNYTFQPYGEVARRARIQGSVMVEVSVSKGRLSNVEFISYTLTSPNTPVAEEKKGPPIAGLSEVITDTINKWEFEQDSSRESIKFRLKFIFRLLEIEPTEGNSFYRFSIHESEGVPTEIVIEAEAPPILY